MSHRTVLSAYNRYVSRGGEDEVFESDVAALLHAGWNVVPVTTRTRPPGALAGKVKFALDALWSREWEKRFSRLVSLARPSVAHFYNTFPAFSPSVLHACKRHGVPVVLTVQNYRLVCPKATLYRDGHVCELCVGRRFPWPGVRYACYHDSRLETAMVGGVVEGHRSLRTWSETVDVFLVASEFSRRKLIEGGLPADKVEVKPNFRHPDPGAKRGIGDYALFVGRLSVEKGVPTLLTAWEGLRDVPLKIVGDGPLADRVEAAARRSDTIRFLGRKPNDQVIELMKAARFLLFPSEWYEGLPVTILEALACGLPVIASRLGAMQEVVREGRSGLFFEPGDAEGLRAEALRCWESSSLATQLSAGARTQYETSYTREKTLGRLEELYLRLGGSAEGAAW